MKIFGLIPLVCAMAYLTAGQEKQEPDTLIFHGYGKSVTWYEWIEPTPCMRAEVLLTTTGGQNPVAALQNLSVEQLHGRYRSSKKKIDDAWAESRRTVTRIDENKMREWKRELALTFVALNERDAASDEEIDQTLSIVLAWPSTVSEVVSNCSYTRSLAANLNIAMAKKESEKSRFRLVADKNGLILGFFGGGTCATNPRDQSPGNRYDYPDV